MIDVHDLKETRNIEIENVGICDVKLPFTFISEREYSTISQVSSGVFVDKDKKGAHLSRIIEVLNENFAEKKLSLKDLPKITNVLLKRVESSQVNLNISFPILIPMKTPISNKQNYIEAFIETQLNNDGTVLNSKLSVKISGAMCCPNSKAISKYGAHSQRADLKVNIFDYDNNISVEKIVQIMQNSFSAPVLSVVKSEDEKFLTETAYENPKFSEDLIRDVLLGLKVIISGSTISAEMKNYESIHPHNVYCKGLIKC